MPSIPRSQDFDIGQWLRQTVFGLWLVTFVAHLLGYGPLTGTLWGAHTYAFFPLPVFITGLGFLAFAGLPLLAGNAIARHWSSWVPRQALAIQQLSLRAKVLVGATISAIGLIILWLFRIRHLLLGDSVVLLQDLPKGTGFHPREPLTMWLHQKAYDYIVTLERFAGRSESEVAHLSTALESIFCGVIFLFVVWKLSRELTPRSTGAHITCALLLLTQGFVLLFFGYPENYTYQTVALGLYLLLSLRFLKGTCGIVGPTLVLVICLGLHLSSLALLPSYAVLLMAGWLDHQRRRATVRNFGILAAAVAALIMVLGVRDETFSIQKLVTNILHEVTSGRGTGSGWSYLLSARHFRDFLNEQFLIGPFALFFFLPAFAFTITRGRSARTAVNWFWAVCGLSYLAGSWMTADPLLGYPRDWDVFAPSALVYASAALGLFFWRATDADGSPPQGEVQVHGALLSAVLVSLFCVLPWIALNASEARALERTKMLPMDFGRDEMVVARYYLNHGQLDEAERWFVRSIGEFKYNVNSYHLLGTLYMRQGKSGKAVTAFQNAVSIRPDKLVLRKQLVVALIEAGQALAAEPHLRVLAESSPTDLPIWRRYGLVLLEMGEIERARRALEHAYTLYQTPALAAQDLVTQCRALASKVANEGNLDLASVCGEFADSFGGSAVLR